MWGPAPAYKITKAALNMLTVQYALEYEKEGFNIFAVSPGVSGSFSRTTLIKWKDS